MNEDSQLSAEEFAHENEHIEEDPHAFPGLFEAVAWTLFAVCVVAFLAVVIF